MGRRTGENAAPRLMCPRGSDNAVGTSQGEGGCSGGVSETPPRGNPSRLGNFGVNAGVTEATPTPTLECYWTPRYWTPRACRPSNRSYNTAPVPPLPEAVSTTGVPTNCPKKDAWLSITMLMASSWR